MAEKKPLEQFKQGTDEEGLKKLNALVDDYNERLKGGGGQTPMNIFLIQDGQQVYASITGTIIQNLNIPTTDPYKDESGTDTPTSPH